MKARVVVDIDNTLWEFAPVLWERLKQINPQVPPPSGWDRWNFWEGYVDRNRLYGTIAGIHAEQDKFQPYPEARPFLAALREKGLHVIIASHRLQEALEPTMSWLHKFHLLFDELHLSDDKSVLFADSCAVVDDSPVTLDRATQAGILRAGLRRPWNRMTEHPLFSTLPEVLVYLEGECSKRKR